MTIPTDIQEKSLTRLIAFYLPQYHPIPENDEWWGKGFTEWTNVSKAKPLFPGHYQPQIPADLGFYDLRLPEVREAQANLAREYGIHGFCYYHYWFNGRMILERPFNEVLESGKPDFPFCLCWANENWSRRWDGSEKEVLLEQNYDEYDPIEHIAWLEKAFRDPRYIRIDGKPVLLVYKAAEIHNIAEIINQWRQYVKDQGYPDLYLCFVRTTAGSKLVEKSYFLNSGFDAHVDFQPDAYVLRRSKGEPMYGYLKTFAKRIIRRAISTTINLTLTDYEWIVNRALNQQPSECVTFPCIFPSWDNSPRRQGRNPHIFQNNDVKAYGDWLVKSIDKTRQYNYDERIVFINAWNEWAEGCHLEPDIRNGRKFLEVTLNTLEKCNLNETPLSNKKV